MNTLQEARKRQDQLRRSAEARIAECRAQLTGELPATRPDDVNRKRIEAREQFLRSVEAGDWPGIRPSHREALRSAGAAGEGSGTETGRRPHPTRPTAREHPSGRLSARESDTGGEAEKILTAFEKYQRLDEEAEGPGESDEAAPPSTGDPEADAILPAFEKSKQGGGRP